MLVKLTDKLSATRRTRIVTEVRESNLAAQLLFANNGFRATTILRGFYEETDEDAYVMEYRLAE
jgi:ribosomal-protein-alanine N-acetyltransferase